MQLALRPYVTTGIAIVGASVLVATPTLATPPDMKALNPAISHADVNPASLITDLVAGFSTVSVAGGHAAQISINTIAGLPLGLAGAANAAIADPSDIPDIVNFLAYSFLYPGAPIPSGLPGVSLPPSLLFQFGSQVVLPLANLLPPPLATLVLTAFGKVGQVIGQGLALLPGNPVAGFFAVGAGVLGLPNIVSSPLVDIKALGVALGQAIGGGFVVANPLSGIVPTQGAAGWVGALPAVLLASLGAAVDNPSQIPGLLSYLTYSLLAAPGADFPPPGGSPLGSPFGSFSLFTTAFAPIAAALGGPTGVLPPALADVFNHLTEVLGEVVAAGLGVLPTPNNPFNPYDDPAMMLVANAKMAAPTPQTPIEAIETSVNVLLGSVKALPGGIEDLATAVQKGYITVPQAVGSLVIGLLDTSQVALKPIIAQLATLPSPIGVSKTDPGLVIKGATALGKVIGEVEAALPQPKKQAKALQGADVQASEISAKPHKKPEFNVTRILDPFQLDAKKDKSDVDAKDKSGPANLLGLPSLPKHQLGDGKISVKDLVNKLGLGKPKKEDKKTESAAAPAA